MTNISSFIKYKRKKLKLTQIELANKTGVGIRFIRELERGKKSLQLDKVNHLLSFFGFKLMPSVEQIDAYDIFWNYFNKAVKISLKNKEIKYGILIKEIINSNENKIGSWQFLSNKNYIKYQQTKNDNLIEII